MQVSGFYAGIDEQRRLIELGWNKDTPRNAYKTSIGYDGLQVSGLYAGIDEQGRLIELGVEQVAHLDATSSCLLYKMSNLSFKAQDP